MVVTGVIQRQKAKLYSIDKTTKANNYYEYINVTAINNEML